MKIATDLNQSRILEGIFPLKTADMCYIKEKLNPGFLYEEYKMFSDTILQDYQPAWSLTALIRMLPKGFILMDAQDEADLYSVWVPGFDSPHIWNDNPLDAVFEMIIWLKENNKI